MVLPCASVIVIIVLLKVAFTCATPEAMFLRSRRRTRVASLPIWFPFAARSAPSQMSSIRLDQEFAVGRPTRSGDLLLAGDRLRRSFAGARIGVGALAADRQVAAMAQAAIAAEILQPLDVELHLAPQIALDHVVAVDHLADLQHLGVGQLRHPPLLRDVHFFHDLVGLLAPDSMDVLQRDHHALVGRDVDTSDTGQGRYSSVPAPRRRYGLISKALTGKLHGKRQRDAHPASGGPASRLNLLQLGAGYVRTLPTSVNLFCPLC